MLTDNDKRIINTLSGPFWVMVGVKSIFIIWKSLLINAVVFDFSFNINIPTDNQPQVPKHQTAICKNSEKQCLGKFTRF